MPPVVAKEGPKFDPGFCSAGDKENEFDIVWADLRDSTLSDDIFSALKRLLCLSFGYTVGEFGLNSDFTLNSLGFECNPALSSLVNGTL